MDQLPAFIVYLGAALIGPAAIARYLIRAPWTTVGAACALWYGLLVLAFGGPFREEAIGWAMIFGMFYSVLAIPILALILRVLSVLWRRLAPQARGG